VFTIQLTHTIVGMYSLNKYLSKIVVKAYP